VAKENPLDKLKKEKKRVFPPHPSSSLLPMKLMSTPRKTS